MLYNENPFKILGVSPTDGRHEIVRQAEEKAFLLDSQKCSDARTILTNPQRRIAAEIRWFLDCNDEEVREIEEYILGELKGNVSNDFSWENYCALTQLNMQLACLDAQDFNNPTLAKYYVLGISRLFEAVDAEDVLKLINENRKRAGFPEVSKISDIESAIGEMRSEIRKLLSLRLQSLPEQLYTQIVTLLSESYSGNQRYKGHAILEDTIYEYQLFINDVLLKKGQAITKTAKFILMGAKKIDVDQAVSDLIDDLFAWDKLAQPLQLGALTKGSSHEESEEMLQALRDLALKLHNEYGMSNESLAITKAIQEVFKELPEYTDLLSDDKKILTRLIKEKETEEILSPILEKLKSVFEELKSCPESERIDKVEELIDHIKNSNTQIKEQYPEKEAVDSLRSSLGLLARSFAVELHNDYQRTDESIRIVNAIEPLFSDLSEVSEKIQEDKKTLYALKQEQENTDKILSGLKEIEHSIEMAKTSFFGNRIDKITTIISKMIALDKLINNSIADAETRNQVRERLAYMVRSVAIDLHNEKKDSDNSLRLITAVKNEFSDMPKLASVLAKDLSTLIAELGYQKVAAVQEQQKVARAASVVDTKEEEKTNKVIRWGILGVVLLLIIIIAFEAFPANGKPTTSPASYSTASTSPKPPAMPSPQTMPLSGKVFYCSTTDRPSSFKVTNNGSANYFMKFVKAGKETTVITFFVRAHSTVEIDMPAELLELRYAYGLTWYGQLMLFGEDTLYAKDEEYYDFSKYTWEISLYTTNNTGQTMDVESIGANEF